MNASTRRTAKKLLDCYSWRGEDFDLTTPGSHKGHAKRMTRRARRRFDKAIVRSEVAQALHQQWQDLAPT